MPLSHRRFDSRPARPSSMPQMARLVIGLVVVLIAMYFAWQKSQERPQPAPPPEHRVRIDEFEPKLIEDKDEPATTDGKTAVTAQIKDQKIRNQDGKVVFQGTIDLEDTLDRISRGERGIHGNDGSVFQNREKRLPQKPSGYYREWVHPTTGLRGPGPQRIVTGKNGEIYYTPDHYETFRRLDGEAERGGGTRGEG
jgi:guanyl-specific ribonuclease Sa